MTIELTPRQIAGKANRAKRKGLSPEGRQALRESATQNRPWLSATGPRTLEGKERSRLNALQHGGRAYGMFPDEVKTFIVQLKRAERGLGPMPPTIRPLLLYLEAIDAYEHRRLFERLRDFRLRYSNLCIREHLRRPDFSLYLARLELALEFSQAPEAPKATPPK